MVAYITPQLGEKKNEQNLHKFDQLKQYKPRDLDCGIVAWIHPEADEISRQTHQWLRDTKQHTLFDEVTFQRFVDMDCPRVLSMTHPDSPFAGTLWIAKLVTMFFVADDYLESQCGDQETSAPETPCHLMIEWNLVLFWTFPDHSEKMLAKLLGIFDHMPAYRKSIEDLCKNVMAEVRKHPYGTAYPEEISPCAAGFLDLWQQAITVMPKEWSLRQGAMYNDYVCWHIRESVIRKNKKVPTTDEYVIHRTGSGSMQMLLGPGADFVDLNFNFPSDEVYFSEKVQHLLMVANLASCLFNDIYSFPKLNPRPELKISVVLRPLHSCAPKEVQKQLLTEALMFEDLSDIYFQKNPHSAFIDEYNVELTCKVKNDELRNGEYHNMVFLISYWRQCSYNEAAEIVMEMVEDINRDIVATSEELTKFLSPEQRRAIEPTIQACINSIPAHNVFHKTSYRYSFNKPLVVVV